MFETARSKEALHSPFNFSCRRTKTRSLRLRPPLGGGGLFDKLDQARACMCGFFGCCFVGSRSSTDLLPSCLVFLEVAQDVKGRSLKTSMRFGFTHAG